MTKKLYDLSLSTLERKLKEVNKKIDNVFANGYDDKIDDWKLERNQIEVAIEQKSKWWAMKISELIEHLQQYDQDQHIMVWDWSTLEHIEIDTVSLYDSDDTQSKNIPLSISVNGKNFSKII